MTSKDFIAALKAAQGARTTYMWGTFGSPLTESLIVQKAKQYPSWYTTAKQTALRKLIGRGHWGFDCVGLIKAILWGWYGDSSKAYGGAAYSSNGVPDVDANAMINKCAGVSTDFTGILPGEAVWMQGHIGVYIGDGRVIEATSSWQDGVQIGACKNLGAISGLNGRKWTKHGKLPWVEYETASTVTESMTDTNTATTMPTLRKGSTGAEVLQIALTKAGYPLTADGIFGTMTDNAVRRFQGVKGLGIDGIVGTKTWVALGL